MSSTAIIYWSYLAIAVVLLVVGLVDRAPEWLLPRRKPRRKEGSEG